MKVLKINRKLKNEKQKEYKKELKQINKTIRDIFPIIEIVEDKSIFKTTYGYMNILQIELKFLEEYRQNKEFYLFFFAENEKAIFERENLLLRLSSDSMKLKKINNEKKIKILFKLNNQNSKT